MMIVENDKMFRGVQNNFTGASPKFGELPMPSDSTLNFVQLPKEEGFSMLAFAKSPRSACLSNTLPVLFDLSHDEYLLEGNKLSENVVNNFRKGVIDMLKGSGAEVLSWKAQDNKLSFTDRLGSWLILDHYGLEHVSRKEFGSLDALVGRFATHYAGSQGLTLPGLLKPFRYMMVTKGCGCVLGPMGNRYRAESSNTLLWKSLDDGNDQCQSQRCLWRYDVWLSEHAFVDVSSKDAEGLDCEVAFESAELPTRVDNISRLVAVRIVDPMNQGYYYKWAGVDPGKAIKLWSTESAKIGTAGPVQMIEEDGGLFEFAFEVWMKPVQPLEKGAETADSVISKPMVEAFQETVGSVLCSDRCSFSDSHNILFALSRIWGSGDQPTGTEPTAQLELHGRGSSLCENTGHAVVQKHLMPGGMPVHLTDFQTLFGQLRAGSEAKIDRKLFNKIHHLYKAFECDFEATFVLTPGSCGDGKVHDLHMDSNGAVTEVCVFPSSRTAPLYKYAVLWDFKYHSRDSLSDEERKVAARVESAGYLPWGEKMFWEDPKLNTDTWYWARSLRQRVFVQRDPRITTALGSEVCA